MNQFPGEERNGETDFSLPSITVPHAPLCCLRTPSCSPHQGALMHADLCRCHTHGFASSAPHCTGISANTSGSLGIRHPVICTVRKGNTLSSQQEYLEGNGSILRRGARLSFMSTLNFAVIFDVSQGSEPCYRYQGGFQLLRVLAELLQASLKSSTQSQRS